MTTEEFILQTAKKFAGSLGRTQYYSADRMLAYQRNLLEPYLRHAREHVPFYQTRLSPLFDKHDDIRWEAWTDIPTITRKDVYDAGDDLFAKEYPPQMGEPIEARSSGSTAAPLKFRTNSMMSIMAKSIGERLFDWYNINRDGKIAFILDARDKYPYPDGGVGHKWNLQNQEAEAYQLSVSEPIENMLQWLVRIDVDYLVTYPAIGFSIAELAEEKGLKVPFIGLFSQGEVLLQDARNKLENKYGVQVYDRYGASEVCPISAQCPDSPHHQHQFADVCLTEYLDLDHDTLISNGRGRLVVTPFYNYAMPLIRYENHDQIEVTDRPCSCGRTLPVIKGILGRERNVFTYEDGSRSWPYLNMRETARFLPAYQIQGIQRTYQDIEILFVKSNQLEHYDADGLEALLRDRLHPSIKLKITEVSEIPRSAAGKFEAWVSMVSS